MVCNDQYAFNLVVYFCAIDFVVGIKERWVMSSTSTIQHPTTLKPYKNLSFSPQYSLTMLCDLGGVNSLFVS